jgi:hypothetical protein
VAAIASKAAGVMVIRIMGGGIYGAPGRPSGALPCPALTTRRDSATVIGMHRSFALMLVAMLAGMRVVSAEPLNCGTPPQLPVQSQEDEKIKGELLGQAQFLSRLIGGGNLKGAVEAEHHTIYQSADAIQAAWQSAYLSYLFCSTVMSDNSLSSQEKLSAIVVFRQGMCTVPQSLLVNLAEFVQEGSKIQADFLNTDDAGAIDQRYKVWESKVEKFVNDNLGVIFLVQFTSVHGGASQPVNHSMIGGAIWAEIQAKIVALNSIIQDLRHC